MIQRMQSVYLFIVFIIMALNIISPIVNIEYETAVTVIHPLMIKTGIQNSKQVLELALVSGVVALISLTIIFLYKKRKIQMQLCRMNTILIIAYYSLGYLSIYLKEDIGGINNSFTIRFGIILPIVALIFNIMAYLKIKADEKLVRSLDRIR